MSSLKRIAEIGPSVKVCDRSGRLCFQHQKAPWAFLLLSAMAMRRSPCTFSQDAVN